MLNVYPIRLRFISARLLASTPSISKGLRKGYFIMLLLKILNVSERTGCPWFHAAAMFLWNKNSPSMRPWRDGVLISSEFCARTKLVFSRHTRMYVGKKCTRRYTSGQSIFKRLTERLFYYVATPLKTPLRIRR